MALINIASLRQQVLKLLAATPAPGGVELLSYKRDRSISVLCQDDATFIVKERGYLDQEVVSTRDGLSRLLKEMIKREFPRSRKVRLVKFADPAELERERQRI
ncbi:hypothetical protein [Desulfogranum mediterraneum]|uniref:hypothetical protein n=1 Tax=Desulfogranum mediterraneum TaxID=160661 RepID=UPI0003F7CE0F|nr:hypothetical protein [Desulfogranum mediterraneum]